MRTGIHIQHNGRIHIQYLKREVQNNDNMDTVYVKMPTNEICGGQEYPHTCIYRSKADNEENSSMTFVGLNGHCVKKAHRMNNRNVPIQSCFCHVYE